MIQFMVVRWYIKVTQTDPGEKSFPFCKKKKTIKMCIKINMCSIYKNNKICVGWLKDTNTNNKGLNRITLSQARLVTYSTSTDQVDPNKVYLYGEEVDISFLEINLIFVAMLIFVFK